MKQRRGYQAGYANSTPCLHRGLYPPIQDLRVTPVWQGSSVDQTSVLIDLINTQTKMFAQARGVMVIDLANCLATHEVGPLLFDSVHYSLKGSRIVAECINGDMLGLNL